KWEGLRVRVVDAEDADPLLDPKQENAFQLFPKRSPIFALEFKRVDVLIFLGRVFSVLNRAVRAMAEPLRVLFHIRMVGGALKGDIEGDFDLALTGGGHQGAKIVQSAQVWMDCLVAPFDCADRPWAADVVRLTALAVVFPFAERPADWVD